MLAHIHPSYSFVACLLGIVIGDIYTLITRNIFVTSPIWLLFALLILLFTFFRPILPFLLLSFLAGCIFINYRASIDLSGQSYFSNLTGKTITMKGTISEDPDTSEQQTAIRLTNLSILNSAPDPASATSADSANITVPGTIYLQTSPNKTLQRSDIITLTGKLSPGFGTFAATIYRPTITNITRPDPGDLPLTLRNWFADHIKSRLSAEQSALGLGYLLGMRSSLPSDLSERLRIVGLTHIIVASGANLSILIGFSRKWLGKISRFAAFFISFFLVLGYVAIVGLAPSMTRAGLVSILSLIVWYVGREFQPWRLLLIVAALTLLISPTYLIDLGWLLSFASFAGILIFGPLVTKFFYGNQKPNFLAATLLETISASLLCIPIILYFFGTMSLISLAANLLILPTISIAMALTFATGLCFFLPPIADIIGKLSALLLDYHLLIINFFGQQHLFLIEIPPNDPRVFLLYIPILLPFCFKKLYNMYKCHNQSQLQPSLRC